MADGHQVAVVHRGNTEPADFPEVSHIHTDRENLSDVAGEISNFRPERCIDTLAMTRESARKALEVIPSGIPTIVLSSGDVYRAYTGVMTDVVTDRVPLYETSPVREEKYPYKTMENGPSWIKEYDKLDVEEEFLARGATIIRLPMVYGEHDAQRREEFILRRVRAGRSGIPIGAGTWLSSRGYVRDMGSGIVASLTNADVGGEIFNLAESQSATTRLWAEQILEAAGHKAELIRIPDDKLPDDLKATGALKQHLLMDSSKARSRLGWQDGDPFDNLVRSVGWHLAHPPEEANQDFSADDEALSST